MPELLRTRAVDTALAWDGPNPCPPLTASEYEALKRSIAEDGYIPAFPVLISAGPACEGQIIDGFHRTQVCAELDVEPIRIFHPCATELEFKILQIKANLERRQLSTAQRALLAVRLMPLYEERAQVRRAETLKQNSQAGQSDPTPVSERGESAHLAAQAAGISGTTLKQMRAVTQADNAEQLLEQISSGAKSIKRAYETLRDVADSIKSERQAEREMDEHFKPHVSTASDAHERATGDVVRLLMEADALIRKHALHTGDVKELRSRPHTFMGAARRLNEWLGALEDEL